MQIYFNDTDAVRGLAKKLAKEVRSWGDTIKLMNALTVVSRAFGYEEYEDLVKVIGYADPSIPDRSVSPEVATKRYEQYVAAIADNDFSREEAVKIVDTLRYGGWWGFGERSEIVQRVYVRASKHRMHVSPQELDRRAAEYLRVLKDAGLNESHGLRLMYEAGSDGWWHLERTEAGAGPRQTKFADRIEGAGHPPWRLAGKRRYQPQRGERPPAKKAAYVAFLNEYPHDEVQLWAFLPGEELLGYCDEVLASLLDMIDLNVRVEVASIYHEVLNLPDSGAEFFVSIYETGQRITELEIVSPLRKQTFSDYASFIQQGGMQRFQPTP
ncbi:hypothetical protein N1937_20370 [Rhizobium sp. WSM4643]|uniref:hypothetical protein n=1 Tax=Rhizobium sp. WSM4643 TaxID=3138253 RepID=UPI0021A26FE0|nr:hypothetical protein [Rhizobium leguminosarum]UWM75015.1 hypothetical protein N1937_20370 [Rhizobium leguminosarum bv. viciae]